jgi:hypothetical protein
LLYRCRLYTPDGDEAGEAHDAVMIQPDEIHLDGRRPQAARARSRAGGGDSLYAGVLMVEPA